MLDYLRFRAFAAPLLIEIAFWFAVALGLGAVVLGVLVGIRLGFTGNALGGVAVAIPAILALPVWLIGVRIACEGLIVVFRIHEELRDGREDAARIGG